MSKTVDALTRSHPRDDVLHEHIVNTYFHPRTRQKSRKKKSAFPIKYFSRLLIAAFSGFAILVSLAVITVFLNARYMEFVRKKVASSKVVAFFDEGSVNKEVIRRFDFRGGARSGKSRISDNVVVLNNLKKYSWADLSLDFKFPVDFSARHIALSLRGSTGGEKVDLVLRDSVNKSVRLGEMSLASTWKDRTISLDQASRHIDLSKITHIRVETGRPGESAREADSNIPVTIYLKNLSAIKEM